MKVSNILIKVNSERWLSLESFPNEKWKDIKGYEGKYQVSSLGRVKSLKRTRLNGVHGKCEVAPRIMRENINHIHKNGTFYFYVSFHNKNGASSVKKQVHRLVAEAFIPNIHGCLQVNHIDENGFNNRVDNLEWCDCSYNNKYGTAQIRAQKTREIKGIMKPVVKLDTNGTCIHLYKSVSEAARDNNINKGTMSYYCKSGNLSNGFKYLYKQ